MIAQIREGTHLRPVRAPPSPEANAIPDSSLFRRAAGDMSRLAAAALRRGVTASRDPTSSLLVVSPQVSARLFSADASGEAAATVAESQDDSFLKASREGNSVILVLLPFPLPVPIRVSSVACQFAWFWVGLGFNTLMLSSRLRIPSKELRGIE